MSSSKSEHARWFAEEVHPHESSLRSYLRGLFPSLPDVDDLVQDSYARLLRAREVGRIQYVKAFLFATARNIAIDRFRRRKIVAIESVADLAALPVIDDRPGVVDTISTQEELELLTEAVRTLPARCRQVFTLRLLYGLSQKEIAARLQLSPHTVKAQLAKGMRRCADYFEAKGATSHLRLDAGTVSEEDNA